MRRDRCSAARRGLPLLALAALSGCGLIPSAQTPPPAPVVERPATAAATVSEHLETMWRLSQANPAEQAELFQSMRSASQMAPTTSNRLRLALALATPGHGATDAEAARQALTGLLAVPQSMPFAEQTLAWSYLRDVENRLVLQAEIDRLQADLTRRNRERNTVSAASVKRLQAEIEENERLRTELAVAKAKLDEITRIERSIIERTPSKTNR